MQALNVSQLTDTEERRKLRYGLPMLIIGIVLGYALAMVNMGY